MATKQLHCPVCGSRLIDAVASNQSELVEEGSIQIGWSPDYFQKCRRCKKNIAIRKMR